MCIIVSGYPLRDKFENWKSLLKDFPHSYFKWYILGGIKNGFPIPKLHSNMWPYVSQFEQRNLTPYESEVIGVQIQKWLADGVIAEAADRRQIHVQPIHVIPKGDPLHPRGVFNVFFFSFAKICVVCVVCAIFIRCTINSQ